MIRTQQTNLFYEYVLNSIKCTTTKLTIYITCLTIKKAQNIGLRKVFNYCNNLVVKSITQLAIKVHKSNLKPTFSKTQSY